MPQPDNEHDENGARQEPAGQKEDQVAGPPERAEAEGDEESLDIEALQQELERWKEQSQHHLDQWKRTAANLENYRKRAEKERAELLKTGQAALIVQLLPILDDLGRAFQTLPFGLGNFTWTEGLALIDRKLQLVLEQQGLAEIDAVGKPFDPTQHQALLEEETAAYPDGHVMAVLQKGYRLHDRVLRPAMVKIARNSQSAEKPELTEQEAEPSSEPAGREAENEQTS